MRIAFSTVACPDWTLERVMSFADETEYDGVELRTFGWGCTDLPCDPALTDAAKVRRLALESGTHVMCLGTSVKFDDRIWPPVLGQVLPSRYRSVEAGKRFLELADDLECPAIRVFGFESPGNERREKTMERIVGRLRAVLDAGRSRRIRVLVENGGSFARAADLAELIEACDSPWVGASYSVAVGAGAGDRLPEAFETLGDRLSIVRLKDVRGSRPVELGSGDVPLREGVEWLAGSGFGGWLVVEWMRYWVPDLAEGEGVLRRAMETLQGWIAGTRRPVREAAATA